MIIVEFNIRTRNEVFVILDEAGISAFLIENSFLTKAIDHNHLFVPSWAGRELDEKNILGEGFSWCHALNLGAVDPDIFQLEKNELQLIVTQTEGEEYTVDLLAYQSGISLLLDKVRALQSNRSECRLIVPNGLFERGKILIDKNKNESNPTVSGVSVNWIS